MYSFHVSSSLTYEFNLNFPLTMPKIEIEINNPGRIQS